MGLKLLEINAVPYGSTAKIVSGIVEVAKENGFETCVYNGWTKHINRNDESLIIGSLWNKLWHMGCARMLGYEGVFSWLDTQRLIRKISEFSPDVIHLHLMHNWYINLPLLFDYLREHPQIKVVWTMHDCWAFTGHCPHFTFVKCDKWRAGCYDCPQLSEYPVTYIDRTKKMWSFKKKWFTQLPNMTLVTPSKWLSGLLKESFLQDYSVRVINNGIDLNVFTPQKQVNAFINKYGVAKDCFIVLGVAFGWGKKKGLDTFIQLVDLLGEKYQIVLVGTDASLDAKLPSQIISIHRTTNQHQLAEIYSAADVFVNPTREDNFPTVNLESLACGTPVITNCVGGCEEMLDDSCGSVVDVNDIDALVHEIKRICTQKPYSQEQCTKRALLYAQKERFAEYIDLFLSIVDSEQTQC